VELIKRAGRIACEARKRGVRLVRAGARLLDIASALEGAIRELGGQPAFPVNISINEEAAHYTPVFGDEKKVPEDSLVKVDVGVSVDGYLADAAVTVNVGPEREDLRKAAEEALERAIEAVRPGARVSDIGEAIERAIRSYGYRPVKNLSGHSMGRYSLHSGLSIPNVSGEGAHRVLKPPALIAIEPFATNGLGWVVEGSVKAIFSLTRSVSERERRFERGEAEFLSTVYRERRSLPFTERWYAEMFGLGLVRRAIAKAERARVAVSYPVLVEASGGLVAQAEDTVLILDSEVIVTTREC